MIKFITLKISAQIFIFKALLITSELRKTKTTIYIYIYIYVVRRQHLHYSMYKFSHSITVQSNHTRCRRYVDLCQKSSKQTWNKNDARKFFVCNFNKE